MMKKRLPKHIEELKFYNCKIAALISKNLIKVITWKTQLKKFALVNVNLSEKSLITVARSRRSQSTCTS
jgi:hypothetical protein